MSFCHPSFDGIREQPLRELLQRFTYRPEWYFMVGAGKLRIEALVIDAYDQSRTTPLVYEHTIPIFVPQDFNWSRWLFDQIMKVERHEAQEFFRVDGVPVYDPHAG